MPDWFGEELAVDIKNAHLVVLEGGGHMLPETRYNEVSSLIVDFL